VGVNISLIVTLTNDDVLWLFVFWQILIVLVRRAVSLYDLCSTFRATLRLSFCSSYTTTPWLD